MVGVLGRLQPDHALHVFNKQLRALLPESLLGLHNLESTEVTDSVMREAYQAPGILMDSSHDKLIMLVHNSIWSTKAEDALLHVQENSDSPGLWEPLAARGAALAKEADSADHCISQRCVCLCWTQRKFPDFERLQVLCK